MNKLLPSFLVIAALAACAPPPSTWSETVDAGLHTYQGAHVHELFEIWGVPDADGEVASARYYLWERSFESTLIEPRRQKVVSMSDREARIAQTLADDEAESDFVTTPVNAHCRIRVFVDLWGRIVSWDGRGNEFGCGRLASDIQKAVGDHERLPAPG